jgi:Na+/H+ antiporter NhaD/arsenite permease-like protein
VRAFAVILLAIGLVGALAASLDHVGVFDELAAVAARSRHVVGALWILAALVVALLNLPMLLLTGSLAGLLWQASARRAGVEVDARRYSRVGVTVGVPAMVAAAVVLRLLG